MKATAGDDGDCPRLAWLEECADNRPEALSRCRRQRRRQSEGRLGIGRYDRNPPRRFPSSILRDGTIGVGLRFIEARGGR